MDAGPALFSGCQTDPVAATLQDRGQISAHSQ
jgi:hypothetical protein